MGRREDIADIEARRMALSGRLAFLAPNMLRARQLRAEQRRLTALALRIEAGRKTPLPASPTRGEVQEDRADRTRWWDR